MAIITTGLTITSMTGSLYYGELPIRADQSSVDRFCVEKGYVSGGTFTQDPQRWANDGARLMNYYALVSGTTIYEEQWLNLYGYDGIITSITEP